MIYHFVVIQLSTTAGVLLMTAGYLGRKAVGITLSGDAGRWRPPGPVGAFLSHRAFWLVPFMLIVLGALAIAPAAVDYVGTGHIDPATHHWSRFFAMSFAFSLAFILTSARLLDITLDLLAGRVAFLKSGVAISSEAPAPSKELAPVTDATAWEKAYQRFETPGQEQRKFSPAPSQPRRPALEPDVERAGDLFRTRQRPDRLAAARVLERSRRRSLARARRTLGLPPVVPGRRRAPACRSGTASRDVAVVQGGLHHLHSLDDVRAALAEMHRVLKPDGRLIVIEPWSTPFLRFVHFVTERRIVRALSGKLDAFAAMTDEERPTYEAWLARPQPILAALSARFEAIVIRRRWGKLVFLGRPLS